VVSEHVPANANPENVRWGASKTCKIDRAADRRRPHKGIFFRGGMGVPSVHSSQDGKGAKGPKISGVKHTPLKDKFASW
jgi:hypothetical protein